jgi:hypothetical protein
VTETERALAEALDLAEPEDRDQVVFAIYGAISLGMTPAEMTERLVRAPQDESIAYHRGRHDQLAQMRHEGWRAPDEGFLVWLLRKLNR